MSVEDKCCICFEEKTNIKYLEGCNHSFCKECINTWNKEHVDCPLCRKIIFPFPTLTTRRNRESNQDTIKHFLLIYFKKKLYEQETDFSYYKELFEVFLHFPYFFFEEKDFREVIESKVMIVRNERMKNWTQNDKRQMNILLESVSNLNKVYQR